MIKTVGNNGHKMSKLNVIDMKSLQNIQRQFERWIKKGKLYKENEKDLIKERNKERKKEKKKEKVSFRTSTMQFPILF